MPKRPYTERDKALNKEWNRVNRNKRIAYKAKWRTTKDGRALMLLDNSRNRAKRLGVEHALTRKWIAERLNAPCPITGRTFDLSGPAKGSRCNPNSPSLDRIDSSKGYTVDNVRVTTVHANVALNEFGTEALVLLSKDIIRTISSQALPKGIEGSTTIPTGSRGQAAPKRTSTPAVYEIVSSLQQCRAAPIWLDAVSARV